MLETLISILPFRMITLLQLGTFNFKLVDAISIIIGLIILYKVAVKKINFKFNKIDILLIVYLIYSFINVFVASNKILAFADLYRLMVSGLSYFSISVMLKNINYFSKESIRLYKIMLYSCIPTIIYSVIIFVLKGIPEIKAFGPHAINSFNVRFSGFYPDPNSYGIYLIMCIIILIELYKIKEVSQKKFMSFATLLIITLILTFSRSAIIMLGIYIIFLINFDGKNKLLQKKIICSGIVLLLGIMIINPFNVRNVIIDRVSNTITIDTENDWAIKSRLIYYSLALEAFKEKPITGIGRGNFYTYGVANYDGLPEDANPQGLIFQVISELGLIGTLILSSIFIILIHDIRIKIKKCDKEESALLSISYGFIITYLVGSMFGTFDSTRELWYILAFASAIVSKNNKNYVYNVK